jgi:hypothetical protein
VSRAARGPWRLVPAVALLAAACATPAPAPPPPAAAADLRPATLLATVARTAAARHALRAVARLALDGPGGSASARQILLVERPARLRVEVLGLLDQTVAVLTTDGARYQLYRAQDRSITQGPVAPSLLWQVAGLAVTPEEAVALLLGAPSLPADARLAGGTYPVSGGARLVVGRPGEAARLRLVFDAAGRLTGWARLDPAGTPLQEARWSDYRALGDGVFPYEVEIVDHVSGTRAEIHYQQVELDPELPAALFELAGGSG